MNEREHNTIEIQGRLVCKVNEEGFAVYAICIGEPDAPIDAPIEIGRCNAVVLVHNRELSRRFSLLMRDCADALMTDALGTQLEGGGATWIGGDVKPGAFP